MYTTLKVVSLNWFFYVSVSSTSCSSFDWAQYLNDTGGTAAPWMYFKQVINEDEAFHTSELIIGWGIKSYFQLDHIIRSELNWKADQEMIDFIR